MEFYKLALLFCFIVEISGKQKTLKSESGNVSSNVADSFRIFAGKGKRVVFKLEKLKLGRGDFLKIRDGRAENADVYKMDGNNIYKSKESGRSGRVKQSLPIVIETESRKLFIVSKGIDKRREKFSGHYTTYSPEGTCTKEHLRFQYGDATITCNSDDLSPVAESCDVTLDCGTKYKQYSKAMTCEDGDWDGHVQCQPKTELIERCSYDFEEFTTDNDCPYSNAEVAQYYFEVVNVEGFEVTLGRSPGRRIQCSATCSHNAAGQWTVNCGGSTGATYVRCLICRVIYQCTRGQVIF